MNKIQLLAKIIYEEVGTSKTYKNGQDKFGGFENVPKQYPTLRDFALAIFKLQKEGVKTYKDLSVDYIIDYAKKFKPKACKTILE